MRSAVLALVFAAWGAPAFAECVASTPLEAPLAEGDSEAEGVIGATGRDRLGRMVAPVHINGRGPFQFIIDTGSNRSVVSDAVASELGLQGVGEGTVHTVQGTTEANLVEVDTLSYQDLDLPSAALPVLGGAMLAGQEGLLGTDGMRGRRLRLDFERRCVEIVPSRNAPRLRAGWTQIRGELRFGHLVVVEGRIRNLRVNVIIDTGSNLSLANRALQRELAVGAERTSVTGTRLLTAGQPIILDTAVVVPRLQLNEMSVGNLLLFVGDFHVFNLWQMQDTPTVLIGMDVISQAQGLAIDYDRAMVYFQLPGASTVGTRLRDNLFRR